MYGTQENAAPPDAMVTGDGFQEQRALNFWTPGNYGKDQ